MRSRMGSIRDSREDSAPTMNVRVPVRAPTTPPDMGASMKSAPWPDAERDWLLTREATLREVVGSIVEQSMKRRDFSVGGGGKAEAKIVSKTDLTWWGWGRGLMILSC